MTRTGRRWRRWGAVIAVAIAPCVLIFAVKSDADHEVVKAREEIDTSIRATFEAFDHDDMHGFLDGWTDRGFYTKTLFRLLVRNDFRPWFKDEAARFFEPARTYPITVTRISNVMVLDPMVTVGSADVEFTQGVLKERHKFLLVKRPQMDKRWKIDDDTALPVAADGLPIVEIKMKEYGFELDTSRLAREMVMDLVNAGTKPHELMLWRRDPSSGTEQPVARGAYWIEPGKTSRLVFTGLEPGRYALTCCLVDPDHRAHCNKGMRSEVTIE